MTEPTSKPEIFCSSDIECNGPLPGHNAMLSFATAAFDAQGALVSSFYERIDPLPGSVEDTDTMNFWAKFPDMYREQVSYRKRPGVALREYHAWLKSLPGIPVFLGWPANFDFQWINFYLMHFCGENPYGHSALDIKTLVWLATGKPLVEIRRAELPPEWFPKEVSNDHNPLHDAIYQGRAFFNIVRELNSRLTLLPGRSLVTVGQVPSCSEFGTSESNFILDAQAA